MEHEVRLVLADRSGDALVAQKRPDALWLATERLRTRRVVHQHDPVRAVRDGAQAIVECRHVVARLPVHLAKQRLAEVGQARAGEAAHKPLQAGDPHLASL
jgi:hypothetical protein